MRRLLFVALAAVVAGAGCSLFKPATPEQKQPYEWGWERTSYDPAIDTGSAGAPSRSGKR